MHFVPFLIHAKPHSHSALCPQFSHLLVEVGGCIALENYGIQNLRNIYVPETMR